MPLKLNLARKFDRFIAPAAGQESVTLYLPLFAQVQMNPFFNITMNLKSRSSSGCPINYLVVDVAHLNNVSWARGTFP